MFCAITGSPPYTKLTSAAFLAIRLTMMCWDVLTTVFEQTPAVEPLYAGVDDALFMGMHGNDIAGGLVQLDAAAARLFKAPRSSGCAHAPVELQHDHGYQFRDINVQNALEHGYRRSGGFVQAGLSTAARQAHIDDGAPAFLPMPDAAHRWYGMRHAERSRWCPRIRFSRPPGAD